VAVTQSIVESSTRPRATGWQKVRGYVQLTKPRVIELLLVTTIPVMILAERGFPDLWLVVATLVGGALSAGSANAFNMWFDRDIDALMTRTANRPLVTGVLSAREALIFSWVTGVVAVAFLWLTTNWVAAALAAGAIAFYVLVYTMLLKRRTPQNIVWGGIAGCMPVLIGWAAVTGTLSWEALILFGVVFLWTPPHYWPLSMRYREDYRAAGVPMLAVVRSETVVALQSVLYAWATVACSLLLIPVAPMGLIYAVVAVASGAWFVFEAHRLYARAIRGSETRPMRLFHGSISYLTILFVAVAVDPLVYFSI
jgi:protoheme IX farnesyltransferase